MQLNLKQKAKCNFIQIKIDCILKENAKQNIRRSQSIKIELIVKTERKQN